LRGTANRQHLAVRGGVTQREHLVVRLGYHFAGAHHQRAERAPLAAAETLVGQFDSAAQLPLVNSFRERFEALLPRIQEQWPSVARHSLEASRGSLEEVAAVIAAQTGRTATVVQEQLLELLQVAGEQTARLADGLEPLEQQLQRLLDELDATLRPRLEAPVRQRPLLAVGLAAGLGLLVGMLLSSRRRQA
jgi:ElaB/YqjD/DUF883 family membrane-anchored ribosome-binding protein